MRRHSSRRAELDHCHGGTDDTLDGQFSPEVEEKLAGSDAEAQDTLDLMGIYASLSEQLEAAETDAEGEAIAAAMVLCTLAVNRDAIPARYLGIHKGTRQFEHDAAIAAEIARPSLRFGGSVPPAGRQAKRRLIERARTHLKATAEIQVIREAA